MKASTAEFIRRVTEMHFQYSIDPARSKKERETEKAYLRGLYDMLQIIGTEAYSIPGKSCNDFLDEAKEN